MTLPSSPNWPPGRSMTFRNGHINDIVLTSSDVNMANSIGMSSGERSLVDAHEGH